MKTTVFFLKLEDSENSKELFPPNKFPGLPPWAWFLNTPLATCIGLIYFMKGGGVVIYLYRLDLMKLIMSLYWVVKSPLKYSWFHIKGTWSVHSFNEYYLSIPSAHRKLKVPFSWNPQYVQDKIRQPRLSIILCTYYNS